jgi:hypothetical protein
MSTLLSVFGFMNTKMRPRRPRLETINTAINPHKMLSSLVSLCVSVSLKACGDRTEEGSMRKKQEDFFPSEW